MKFIPSHVSFILKSNSENCIIIRWFLTKLQTTISWLLFMAHSVDVGIETTACAHSSDVIRYDIVLVMDDISKSPDNHVAERLIRFIWLIFERPFVKRFVVCYRTVVLSCLSCLSVTLVYCSQTIGQIKMKLGLPAGLGPGHIVLDGDPAPLSKRGQTPNFRPMSIVAKRLDGSRCHLIWT